MTIDLNEATSENLQIILNQIADKLDVANRLMFDDKHYTLKQYNDIKFLHDHIMQIDRLSPPEVQAFVDELRSIRDA